VRAYDERKTKMSNPLDEFLDKKAADSPYPYISLIDGDSIRIKSVKEIKQISKVGFTGEEVDCIRLVCVVETEYGDKVKNFDNSSGKFAKALKENEIAVGSSFTLTRDGEGPKTTYKITDVKHAEEAVAEAGL
jgi:hypothetical protein